MKTSVIFITGSTKGIGKAIADKFEAEGHVVVRNSREAAPAYKHYVRADIGSKEGIAEIIKYFSEHDYEIDTLINNAAHTKFIEHSNLIDLTDDLFNEMFNVNLKGPFLLIQGLKDFIKPTGSIINIASVAGVNAKGSNVGYCALKAGLINLTQSLARALGPIRVNSISPGLVLTDFVKFPDGYLNNTIQQTPVGRAGQPNDIAELAYTITKQHYITGHNFIIDGGRTLN